MGKGMKYEMQKLKRELEGWTGVKVRRAWVKHKVHSPGHCGWCGLDADDLMTVQFIHQGTGHYVKTVLLCPDREACTFRGAVRNGG